MKKRAKALIVILLIAFVVLGLLILVIQGIIAKLDGSVSGKSVGGEFAGIPESEQICMQECVAEGCDEDMNCMTSNKEKCMERCGAKPTDLNEDEQCVQDCMDQYCTEGSEYGSCMNQYQEKCDEECGMKGDAPDESEMSNEEKCISACVAEVDPKIICGSGKAEGQGEQGNEVCQKCSNECTYLYEGPCLTDEKWREKEEACMSQGEHMEAKVIQGDSGEGYECTINLECFDRSNEWGDEPGTGPGIGEEGFVAKVGETVGSIVDSVVGFFKGLFD